MRGSIFIWMSGLFRPRIPTLYKRRQPIRKWSNHFVMIFLMSFKSILLSFPPIWNCSPSTSWCCPRGKLYKSCKDIQLPLSTFQPSSPSPPEGTAYFFRPCFFCACYCALFSTPTVSIPPRVQILPPSESHLPLHSYGCETSGPHNKFKKPDPIFFWLRWLRHRVFEGSYLNHINSGIPISWPPVPRRLLELVRHRSEQPAGVGHPSCSDSEVDHTNLEELQLPPMTIVFRQHFFIIRANSTKDCIYFPKVVLNIQSQWTERVWSSS